MSNNDIIYKQLKHLGVPANLSGYIYLKEAIRIVLEDPKAIHRMTKQLYPTVAEVCDSTAARVERAIRHAIEYVFDNTDYNIVYEYFGNTNRDSGKLTNTQFIAGVVEYIRTEVLYD